MSNKNVDIPENIYKKPKTSNPAVVIQITRP